MTWGYYIELNYYVSMKVSDENVKPRHQRAPRKPFTSSKIDGINKKLTEYTKI